MSRHHGRAIMPFGKYKGVRVRLLPDSYLSWLTTSRFFVLAPWNWLKESVIAELRYRGLRHDLAGTDEMKREYHYKQFTANMGVVLEIEEALGKAHFDHFEVDSIRIHPEGSVELVNAICEGMTKFMLVSLRSELLTSGVNTMNQYRNKWTGRVLPVISDTEYPRQWFALECEQPSTGTEVPELLIGNTGRKIKLGS